MTAAIILRTASISRSPTCSAKKPDTLGNRRRFRSYLKTHRPDRLVTYNWGSLEWAMANWPQLLPHVHIEDGFGPEEADRQLPRRVLTRRLVLSRSQVVVPSRTLERIALDVWRLDPRRVRYIPSCIDCARFSAPGIVPFDWPGSGPVIGTLAALRPEKNSAAAAGCIPSGARVCSVPVVDRG